MFKFKNLILILSVCFLFGCGDEAASGGGSGSNPSRPNNPIDNTEVGDIETSGFWVNILTKNQFPAYIDSERGFGTPCVIESDTTTNETLNCFVDVMEGDLFVYDFEMQYNVPPDMCEHLLSKTSWFWNKSVGTGPTSVNVAVDATGANPVVTSCQARRANTGTNVNCSAHPELKNVGKIEGPDCVYDEGALGKNCCFGDYNLTITTTTTEGSDTTTQSTNWGGDNASCIGGAAMQGWGAFVDGIPADLITPIPEANTSSGGGSGQSDTVGLNSSYIYTSSLSTSKSGFSVMSNYYETSGTPHTHSGFYDARVSNQPYAFDPIDDLDGNRIPSGNEAFEFSCLDGAFEQRQKIKVYIREWNTFADFVLHQSTSGATTNPDVTGPEGTACDNSDIFGGGCNDFADFKDLLQSVGGSYDTTPGVPAGERATYFPNINYE